MGVLNYIGDKLRGTATNAMSAGPFPSVTIRYNLYTLIDVESEFTRTQRFQRLYDYYIGDEKQIKIYLEKTLAKTFAEETLKEMQFPYFNITKRVIDRLCLAYKLPAERYIVVPKSKVSGATPETMNSGKSQMVEDPKMAKAAENYQELLNGSNINAQAKRWHRLSRLCDTAYVGVVWREDHIEYDIYPPHLIFALEQPDNYLEPVLIGFRKLQRLPDGSAKLIGVGWTADENWVEDHDPNSKNKGKKLTGDDYPDGTNPYGVIPYIPLRMREIENHWGEGDSQLVDVNEQINVLLCSTFDNAIMQSHGQPVAVNMDIQGKLLTGPKHVISASKVMEGQFPPSFHFESPNPATADCMAMVDWMLRRTAVDHGLPPASVSLEDKPASGASKAVDNFELIENRQDDIEILRPFEKKLFDISRIVWNYHNPSMKIDESAEFGIDFQEIQMPIPEKDELAVKQQKLQLGLWVPTDDIKDEDEGIDEEAALAIVQKNLEIRNALNDQYGIATIAKPFPPEVPEGPAGPGAEKAQAQGLNGNGTGNQQ